jgi:SpoVK/Ycf46/Vps4 family AAA+-type ATPase
LHDIKEPLEELNNMIGINDLKNNIVDQILYFVQELHKGNKTKGDFMHTVIYGPPGTGKTEIAKIMGKLYSKIGVLTEGTFKKVTRSDLIAGYLGQTAIKTSDVIKSAIGGVLFIDEAYALGNPEKRDSFAKECIDTLCEALSDNKDNLMVIIAGYEKELKDCFFVFNQGLESRFTWRFKTDEYNGEDLYHIFMKMVKDIGWECEEKSQITVEWFNKRKDYFKFYGRDIETVLAKTKIAHSRRVFCKCENEKRRISLQDLDKGFEIYLKNEEVKTRKDEIEKKKQLYNTLYC